MVIRKKGNPESLKIHRAGEMEYLTFPELDKTGIVAHLFSTRLGGVSGGHLASMNLSYSRGDQKENVDENFRRIAGILHTETDRFVFTDQTHTANVRVVSGADAGKGILRPRDYTDVDGLVTREPGLVLSAFFADCVPLYFVDPVQKAIGLSHSGWKGTVLKIGKATVELMQSAFGSRPEDMIAAIGPSICRDCYEVSEDVAVQVREAFPALSPDVLMTEKGGGKYQLDLWEACRQGMLEAGILQERISVTDLCTCCNPNYLFSHRATQGRRGNLGAFLMLKES